MNRISSFISLALAVGSRGAMQNTLNVPTHEIRLAIFIEGPVREPRDPLEVANKIVSDLTRKVDFTSTNAALITQGDPISESGVAPVSFLVAEALGLNRVLLCVDEEHHRDADKRRVVETFFLDELANHDIIIQAQIDQKISEKINAANVSNQRPLPAWYFDYARLQETGKAVMRARTGADIMVYHTVPTIRPHSVTSFCEVGLGLGLYSASEVYNLQD